jgi:hypothetical protein
LPDKNALVICFYLHFNGLLGTDFFTDAATLAKVVVNIQPISCFKNNAVGTVKITLQAVDAFSRNDNRTFISPAAIFGNQIAGFTGSA